ncbi:head GIN domain-containing protein [uncultured Polaribacter sp.]|uniref:head GIN domain-containing protein n=1 Tax=uncultured Polaribacter sp. TaxID=174711 RepID=UPI002606151A|nr:head GIN domain-containing protein [uncultured Polaribacter sp.]
MTKKTLFTTLLITLTLTINAQDWWNNKKIKGNGNLITVNRTTLDYNNIEVAGSFHVFLVKGKEGKITIEGEENIIEYLETEVSGSTLQIKFEKGVNAQTTKKLIITVPFQSLEKVSLGGSGKIKSTAVIKASYFKTNLAGSGDIALKVDAEEVASSIAGSGNISLEGNTKHLVCAIAGSGDVKAYDLKTKELSVKITGSGSIKTHVTSMIKAKIVGSGSVYYKGNPSKIDSKSVGSGDIIDKN